MTFTRGAARPRTRKVKRSDVIFTDSISGRARVGFIPSVPIRWGILADNLFSKWNRFSLFFFGYSFFGVRSPRGILPPVGPAGQAEHTRGLVGGKKNNKARRSAWGPQTSFTSPIIIKAMLGCLLNLHNTILTLLLQLSITAGRGLSPSCLFSSPRLCLVFICPSTNDWFPTVSPPYVQQIWIFFFPAEWWSTDSANNKQKYGIQKKKKEKKKRLFHWCLSHFEFTRGQTIRRVIQASFFPPQCLKKGCCLFLGLDATS